MTAAQVQARRETIHKPLLATSIDAKITLASPQAQRAVLASIMLNNGLMHEVELTADDFFGSTDQLLFRCMLKKWADGEPFDASTIAESLEHSGPLESVVGPEYLAEIIDGAVPDAGLLRAHAKAVRRFSHLRKLCSLGEILSREPWELGAQPERLLEKVESAISSIRSDLVSDDPRTRELRAVSFQELANLEIKCRDMILAPVLPMQGMVMVFAPRGVGKTWLAMGMSAAAASGGTFLRWRAEKCWRVLYVDGELPAVTVQERLAATIKMQPLPYSENLKIITPDLQGRAMPDLATDEGQRLLEPHLADRDLIVLDNLSALCRSGKENEGESWLSVQGWLLQLRRRGITTLLLHHTGKNGSQRGTSRREDLLDVVISLRRPNDYEHREGLRLQVHFEKTRGMLGDEAKPFEVRLAEGSWLVRDLDDAVVERAKAMFATGMTVRDVAEELSISKSRAGRIRLGCSHAK
jgi:KaiC/GvpD/RAD55 family RecA-like ATPase